MQKPRYTKPRSLQQEKRRGKNEKEENIESFDYIVAVICEEKKGTNIKFL